MDALTNDETWIVLSPVGLISRLPRVSVCLSAHPLTQKLQVLYLSSYDAKDGEQFPTSKQQRQMIEK